MIVLLYQLVLKNALKDVLYLAVIHGAPKSHGQTKVLQSKKKCVA